MADPADHMFALLEEERAALLSAEFTHLPALAERKAQVAEGLASTPPGKAAAKAIRAGLDRNQMLLAAARSGLGAARRRIEQGRETQSGFDTYGPDGQVSRVSRDGGTLQRKA